MARILGPDLVALQVRGVALWLSSDDPDALCASLEGAGVPILQHPQDGPFGRTFVFRDPDGYALTVHGSGQ